MLMVGEQLNKGPMEREHKRKLAVGQSSHRADLPGL
jgi:hypothetical protein